MSSERRPASAPASSGLKDSLSAGLAAALTAGLLFGLLDALLADLRIAAPHGFLATLGCYAGSVMAYVTTYGLVLGLAALGLHPLLRRQAAGRRFRVLLAAGLSAGLFLELYWWTRPLFFYGASSVSPQRLLVAAVLALLALCAGWFLAGILQRQPLGLHRALRGLSVAGLLLGFSFIVSERRGVAERGRANERNRDLPNVLLVVVDALRDDVLGCYGNERVKTPVMDGLAARGLLFENARVQAPYTWASFGSFLTGKYPRRHGLLAQEPGRRMVRDHVTLPWHLKTARRRDGRVLQPSDWTGGAFMTGALSHGSGLDRGFDVYAEAMMGHDLVETDSQWSVFRSELLLWLFKSKLEQRVDSALVVTLARRWIRQNQDRRWVAMVHLYSTHTPYDPPEQFRRMYVDPAYDGPFKAFYADHRYRIERGEYDPTPADVAQIRNLYYAGVSQADAMLGELLEELGRLGLLEETLVILTSDHGEDLGERPRVWEHNHMWQTNLAVPLILAWPGRLPEGRRLRSLVESVDLLPTVCDLLELELPAQDPADPYSLIDGLSLLPLLEEGGDERGIKPWSFAENAFHLSIQDLQHKLIVPRDIVVQADSEALFDPRLPAEFHVHFHDLVADPGEFQDLARPPVPPAREARMRELFAELLAWSQSLPEPADEVFITSRDEENRRLFESLGYVGTTAPSGGTDDKD